MNTKKQKGMAAVELALILPLLAVLLYCLIEGGNAIRTYAAISEIGREAARMVIREGPGVDVAPLVEALAVDLPASDIDTTVAVDQDNNIVTVEVSYEYPSFFNNVPLFGETYPEVFTLTASTSMPLP
ncbi:MAG: TadE/TadG family type IV pilus assembly protein [Thermodesulfobacteriota bacterium]|nr:TadE/TadG family type IV pilus assembly protein [Thermodesulfobacteriota bacterium]